MKIKETNIQKIITLSKNNPSNYIVLEDGGVVYNGYIFKDYGELVDYFTLHKKTLLFIDNLKPL
ncbi:MAG: hypothetical protein GKR88_01395 [Flavobacteriaceae bacterium]|nr:MAG: hypothetical protein GKR88_01395 [Flavobacteriaceae bacterium]